MLMGMTFVPEWTQGDRMSKALRCSRIGVGEMADQLGVSRNTVGKWLADKARPPKSALLVFAALTEVPYEWITDGETPAESDGGLRVVAGARFELATSGLRAADLLGVAA